MRLSALLPAAMLAALAVGARAAVDESALFKHLPKALPFPPGVEFKLKDLHPSTLPGFQTGTLEGTYKGHSQDWPIQISDDGRYYILSDVYTLGPSKVPGFIAPQGDADAPNVQISKDASHALVGEFEDLSVDPDKVNYAKEKLKGVPYRGSGNGELYFVEYSDLECPYCRAAHQALDKELLAAYGQKIRWIFKFNPLPMHKWAYPAAIAAACATEQKPELGWKLESGFFDEQPTIPNDIAPADFEKKAIALADKAGVNEKRFTECFDKQQSKPAVEADMAEAHALGLNSTPAFVVNGRIVHGFNNFDMLKETIDAMLAEKGAK